MDNSQEEEPVRVVMSSQADDSDMIDDEDATVEVRMFLLYCIVNLMKFSRKLNVYEMHLVILAQTFRKMPHPFFYVHPLSRYSTHIPYLPTYREHSGF